MSRGGLGVRHGEQTPSALSRRRSGSPPRRGGNPHPPRWLAALDFFVCTTDNERMTAHAYPRATRAAGQQTRRALLDAAGALFAERGLAGVSAAEIARAA